MTLVYCIGFAMQRSVLLVEVARGIKLKQHRLLMQQAVTPCLAISSSPQAQSVAGC